jgi:NTP pyrophosphatase (non-canonical NTP hydrolase)
MNIQEFQKFINGRYTADRVPVRASNLAHNAELVHALLGLNGEVGELTDLIKKHLMYNKPLDWKAAVLELGDVQHYLMRVMWLLSVPFEAVLETHKIKLEERDRTNPSHYMTDDQLVADLNSVLQQQLDAAKEASRGT